MKYILLILLFTNIAYSKCHVTSLIDQQGCNVILCTTGFVPESRIGDPPIIDGKPLKNGCFAKPFIPLIAEEECEDCTPQGCDLNEVLRGDRDEDGIQEAWCVGPTQYVLDVAKKNQAEAAELARQAAENQARADKAALKASIVADCAAATGLLKKICLDQYE